jgi:putative 4-mercaptohistidine N1-methyltranferase
MNGERHNPYETEALVNQYLEFHYGGRYFDVDNYPRRCVEFCLRATDGLPRKRALDLGCAVGRSTFELARVFESAVGVDLSTRFIAAANHLKAHGTRGYALLVEGDFSERSTADLSAIGLADARVRTAFSVGDACNLDHNYMDLDLVFAGNLLDRLYEPRRFLRAMKTCLRLGGVLVISSPYTLLAEFTPRENWLSEHTQDAGYVNAFQAMRKILEPDLRLLQAPVDVPFVIRETARKFQHTIAELSMWQRRR